MQLLLFLVVFGIFCLRTENAIPALCFIAMLHWIDFHTFIAINLKIKIQDVQRNNEAMKGTFMYEYNTVVIDKLFYYDSPANFISTKRRKK